MNDMQVGAFDIASTLPIVYINVSKGNFSSTGPRSLMDKASDFESEDSRFESWRGR